MLHLAIALSDKKDSDGPIQHYRKALEVKPDYAVAHYNLGNDIKRKKDFDGAIQHYRRAFELNPKNAWRDLNNLGLAQKDKNDLDGTLKTFQEFLAVYPNHAFGHCNLGIILLERRYRRRHPTLA